MSDPTRSSTDWRPLALILAGATALYAIVYRLMPLPDMRGIVPWPFFAWSLYAGARLTPRVAFPLVLTVVGLTDLILYQVNHYPPTFAFYPCLALSLFMGWGLFRRSESLVGAATASVCGYGVFFLVTNFAAWLEPARDYYKPYSFQTLLTCYREGLEFLRSYAPGQLYGDILFSVGLFAAHTYLAKLYFPAERVAAEGVR
jgi:hypothetical protein